MITNRLRFVDEEASDDTVEGVSEQKRRLRAYMKDRRGLNVNKDVKETLLIENFFKAVFPEITGAGMRRNVFVYLSFSSEAPTDMLIERLIENGCNVYCPRIEKGEMQAVTYGEDFSLSDYGIREPLGEIFDGETDIIVLPLLAVDEKGNRLGYGGGYYDRYLRKHPKTKRIAYCYDFQIAKNVPTDEWDEKVDLIVTDKRILFADR